MPERTRKQDYMFVVPREVVARVTFPMVQIQYSRLLKSWKRFASSRRGLRPWSRRSLRCLLCWRGGSNDEVHRGR